jgi:DNA-binding CsgD family transcriptional regulator
MAGELRRTQVRRLLSLVGEAFELADDPAARQQHLLVGLSDLFDAQLGAAVLDNDFGPGRRGEMVILGAHGGGSDSDRARFVSIHIERGAAVHPVVGASMERPDARRPGGVLTVRRQDLFEDRTWSESEFVQDCLKPCRYGEPLVSMRGTHEPHQIQGLAFHRAWGDKPFLPEDRDLLHIFMQTCSSLFGDWSPSKSELIAATLCPRERDTLDLLLSGMSEKEIAAELDLSPHTVHGYMKTIHRAFDVRSRAELMARFVRRPRRLEL